MQLTPAAEIQRRLWGTDPRAWAELARERLPDADLREGDMESLPFADAAFDAVLGVNAFQFAGDPVRALREAARVVRPGGIVAASLFAAPERSQSTVVHHAMAELIP